MSSGMSPHAPRIKCYFVEEKIVDGSGKRLTCFQTRIVQENEINLNLLECGWGGFIAQKCWVCLRLKERYFRRSERRL